MKRKATSKPMREIMAKIVEYYAVRFFIVLFLKVFNWDLREILEVCLI